jgi:DNA-binding XRE family transcriptional regulator
LHDRSIYFGFMSDASERLKQAREKSGYHSAKAAAEAMGVAVPTYIQHENGTRGFPAERAARYARFFRVKPESPLSL